MRIQLVQVVVATHNAPPDAVQRLDQTGDAAGFNGVANVGLHTAELKHLSLLFRLGTAPQGAAAGGSLDGICDESAGAMTLHDIHIQGHDPRLPTGLDQHCLLCRSIGRTHARALSAVLGGTTHNGSDVHVIILHLYSFHFLLALQHHGAHAFRPHVSLRAGVEGEASPTGTQEPSGRVGGPPGLGEAQMHPNATSHLLDVPCALLLN
mmetsp:Transcript_50239/g.109375  ORF Transcript_50239/g.109375 Transcript_50239/m.109375 type:complete len:208 (+) Transcript_50239:775-1398(+)